MAAILQMIITYLFSCMKIITFDSVKYVPICLIKEKISCFVSDRRRQPMAYFTDT